MTDDTHTHTPPTFLERLGRLAGQTTYREPCGSFGTRFGSVPEANGLVLTLTGARHSESDIGPELAVSRVIQNEAKKGDVVSWLMRELKSYDPRLVARCRKNFRTACEVAYMSFITEIDIPENADVTPDERDLLNAGYYLLDCALGEVLGQAERNEGKPY